MARRMRQVIRKTVRVANHKWPLFVPQSRLRLLNSPTYVFVFGSAGSNKDADGIAGSYLDLPPSLIHPFSSTEIKNKKRQRGDLQPAAGDPLKRLLEQIVMAKDRSRWHSDQNPMLSGISFCLWVLCGSAMCTQH